MNWTPPPLFLRYLETFLFLRISDGELNKIDSYIFLTRIRMYSIFEKI